MPAGERLSGRSRNRSGRRFAGPAEISRFLHDSKGEYDWHKKFQAVIFMLNHGFFAFCAWPPGTRGRRGPCPGAARLV